MRGSANTKITILRGTEQDGYGDEVDSDAPIYTGVVASIISSTKRVYLPAEGATRVVHSYSGRCGAEVDLRKDDRVKDELTGVVYLVTELTDSTVLAGMKPDHTFTLSRTA